MARIKADISQVVGKTPLVRLNRIAKGLKATIIAKITTNTIILCLLS